MGADIVMESISLRTPAGAMLGDGHSWCKRLLPTVDRQGTYRNPVAEATCRKVHSGGTHLNLDVAIEGFCDMDGGLSLAFVLMNPKKH